MGMHRAFATNMARVAIIGAGASGMKVAFDLADAGVEVDVFEAGDRVGGRARSVSVGDEVVDLGAEAFEAGEQSRWFVELRNRNALPKGIVLVDPFDGCDSQLYWYPEGKLKREEDVDAVLFKHGAREASAKFESNIEGAQDVAVAEGVNLASLQARLAFQVSSVSAFSESIEPSRYSAQDRSRNDSAAVDMRPFLEGKPFGVGNLFLEYGRVLGQQRGVKIRMVPIKAIERRLEGGWTLRAGEFAGEPYDAVVLTVSVGALAHDELPLPHSVGEGLKAAFDGIELGGYSKVAFVWPAAAEQLGPAPARYFYVDRQATSAWQVTKLARSSALVVAVAGTTALDLTETQTIEMAADVVRLTLKPSADARQVVASNWHSNRLFHGAYSYSRAGAGAVRPALFDKLAESRALGLFLAGEALSLGLYGSLEATWYTGQAAAEQCVRYLGLQRG